MSVWLALEQVPGLAAVPSVWHELTGDQFPAFRNLCLEPSPLPPIREFIELAVPHDRPEIIARLHKVAQVVERNYNGAKARIPPHLHEEFAPFILRELQTA